MPASPGGEEGGELVETGGFRVDRGRALDKLRAFRNESVGAVFLFVRAAVASGARALTVAESPASLTLEWDGPPLSPRFFDDPYSPLFAEGAGRGRPERWAALALLHAFGPGVRRVSVESGEAGRRRFAASDIGSETAEPPLSSGGTRVVIELSRDAERLWAHPLADDPGAPPGVVWAWLALTWPEPRRRLVAQDPPPHGLLDWEDGAARGRLLVPEESRHFGKLNLYVDGALAGVLDVPSPWGLAGRAEVPGLRLDASLSSFSEGPETEASEARAAERFPRFVAQLSQAHAGRMARSVEAMRRNPWLERLWLRRLREGPGVEGGLEALLQGPQASATPDRADAARAVVFDAQATSWLRALFAAGMARESMGPAPLALGPALEPVTAESLLARRGELWFAKRRGGSSPAGALTVWEDGAVPAFWSALKG